MDSQINQLRQDLHDVQHQLDIVEQQYSAQLQALSAELELSTDLNRKYQQQITYLEQEIKQRNTMTFSSDFHSKQQYSLQLELLLLEVQKLNDILGEKSLQLQNATVQNEHLSNCLRIIECNYDELVLKNDTLNQQVKVQSNQIEMLKQEKVHFQDLYAQAQIQVQKLSIDLQCQKAFSEEYIKHKYLQDHLSRDSNLK